MTQIHQAHFRNRGELFPYNKFVESRIQSGIELLNRDFYFEDSSSLRFHIFFLRIQLT